MLPIQAGFFTIVFEVEILVNYGDSSIMILVVGQKILTCILKVADMFCSFYRISCIVLFTGVSEKDFCLMVRVSELNEKNSLSKLTCKSTGLSWGSKI